MINKLNLKFNDKLVIEAKHDGFVVCKIEEYSQSWMDKFDREWREIDTELRQMFTKGLNNSNKKDKKEISSTEVL